MGGLGVAGSPLNCAVADESELHQQIQARWAGMSTRHPWVMVGPGDDCAVLRVRGDAQSWQALSVDQLVEGRHFTPETPVDLIARKAMARAASDLAAMAALPRWSLAAGVLRSGDARAEELCERLAYWGEVFGVPVVGGDLATYGAGVGVGEAALVLSVTVCGEGGDEGSGGSRSGPHGAVLRSGARVGDGLYVTGRVGNSLASGRHLTFWPRVVEALELRRVLGVGGGVGGEECRGRLHAMIDVSDGLGRDAARLAAASGLGVRIVAASVPLHEDVRAAGEGAIQHGTIQHETIQRAMSDGEDYELLFAAADDDVPCSVASALSIAGGEGAECGRTLVTRIGTVVEATAGTCEVELEDGRVIDAAEFGWEHR